MSRDFLAPFFDGDGRLIKYPARRKKQIEALKILAARLERGREYTESEINEALGELHTFGDHCLLRRDMCDLGLLERAKDGAAYRVYPKDE